MAGNTAKAIENRLVKNKAGYEPTADDPSVFLQFYK